MGSLCENGMAVGRTFNKSQVRLPNYYTTTVQYTNIMKYVNLTQIAMWFEWMFSAGNACCSRFISKLLIVVKLQTKYAN